jgi:hypothetical protein
VTGYRQNNQVLISGRSIDFSLHYCTQTGSGILPASYSVVIADYFSRGKATI